jgi:hypothetical protein
MYTTHAFSNLPLLLERGAKKCWGLLGFTLVSLVVVRHLKPCSPKAALDIESLVGFAAVQNALVAAHFLRDIVERLDDPQAELLALLVAGDGDVLDVADESEAVDAAGGEKETLLAGSLNEEFDPRGPARPGGRTTSFQRAGRRCRRRHPCRC